MTSTPAPVHPIDCACGPCTGAFAHLAATVRQTPPCDRCGFVHYGADPELDALLCEEEQIERLVRGRA